MRRSPQAWAALGAACATVMTIVAVSVASALRPWDEPRGAPASPTTFPPDRDQEWLPTAPEGFEVSAGLPDSGGDVERVSDPVTWRFCDEEAFPLGQARDTVRAGRTGPEYADRRDLRVFRDDRAAHDFVAHAAAVVAECPEERHGATRWIHSSAPVEDRGEESLRIVQTYETDGMVNAGATWWDVVRVGNAVLVTATGGEYLPGETLEQGIREHQRLLAPVVASMCAFSAEECGPPQD